MTQYYILRSCYSTLLVIFAILGSNFAEHFNNFNINVKVNKQKTTQSPARRQEKLWNFEAGSAYGPDNWQRRFTECRWTSQSPVDIPERKRHCQTSPILRFVDYDRAVFGDFAVRQYRLEFTVKDAQQRLYADLSKHFNFHRPHEEFKFEKMVILWNTNGAGSEHTVDGRTYPLEIQLFHKLSTGFKLAISVFGRLSTSDHTQLGQVILATENMYSDEGFVIRPPINLSGFIPDSRNNFFVYEGSIPHPPCTEEVTWVVFRDPIRVSLGQLQKLNYLHLRHPTLMQNRRPLQPFGPRRQFYDPCGEVETDASVTWNHQQDKQRSQNYLQRRTILSKAHSANSHTADSAAARVAANCALWLVLVSVMLFV